MEYIAAIFFAQREDNDLKFFNCRPKKNNNRYIIEVFNACCLSNGQFEACFIVECVCVSMSSLLLEGCYMCVGSRVLQYPRAVLNAKRILLGWMYFSATHCKMKNFFLLGGNNSCQGGR